MIFFPNSISFICCSEHDGDKYKVDERTNVDCFLADGETNVDSILNPLRQEFYLLYISFYVDVLNERKKSACVMPLGTPVGATNFGPRYITWCTIS